MSRYGAKHTALRTKRLDNRPKKINRRFFVAHALQKSPAFPRNGKGGAAVCAGFSRSPDSAFCIRKGNGAVVYLHQVIARGTACQEARCSESSDNAPGNDFGPAFPDSPAGKQSGQPTCLVACVHGLYELLAGIFAQHSGTLTERRTVTLPAFVGVTT